MKGATMSRQKTLLCGVCISATVLLVLAANPLAQTSDTPERYTATAVNLGQPGPTGRPRGRPVVRGVRKLPRVAHTAYPRRCRSNKHHAAI